MSEWRIRQREGEATHEDPWAEAWEVTEGTIPATARRVAVFAETADAYEYIAWKISKARKGRRGERA